MIIDMRDRLLAYAVAASIGVHLVLLGFVGKTSAAQPIPVEQLKVVRVDLVKEPDQPVVQQDRPEAPKPKVEAPPEAPYVPPVNRMVMDKHPPRPVRPPERLRPSPPRRTPTNPGRTRLAGVPGDPGGPLRGITAPNGEDLGQVPSGGTPSGWVPGSDTGRGVGSGSGAGIGTPDPNPDARPGPGTRPGPEPPSPPPPRMVSVSVCAVSGMLPGPYCEKKELRSFREGSEPGHVCSVCKAPEPKHISTLADRSEPELVYDGLRHDIRLPDIDEPGDYTVRIRYTVNTDGSVGDVEVIESSGIPAIDRAVRDAARKMRYKPAVQNGVPRSVKMTRSCRVRI